MALPKSFAEFLGNTPTVESLRASIAAGRFPHSLILGGPLGAGKYTLALMLTMALECERQPREVAADGRELACFCGECRNCTRIAESSALDEKIAEAVAVREEMRDTDKRETRVLVQTHPDVMIVPPDPPQLLIKLGQVRTMIQRAAYLPVEAPAKVFVLTSSAMMKEAANSLLKLLEEPPSFVYLILLTENVSEFLPTIRSRCSVARLGALPAEEIAALLAAHKSGSPKERELVARLSEGAVGRALGFDLAAYVAGRNDAMMLLRTVERTGEHAALFKVTETYRAGADGHGKTLALLRAMGSVLEDILLLGGGAGERVRNVDIRPELERMADTFSFAWIEAAVRGLDGVRSGMRRNLLRNVSLDAFAMELEEAGQR
jgi:DNA polymerase-3 subunit delta'